MATNIEKQLNQLSAELAAVKQEFVEFRQAVENTFSASGIGLGVEFGRQLHLLKKKNAPPVETIEVAPQPSTEPEPTLEEIKALRAALTQHIADMRTTLPPLDQALKIAHDAPSRNDEQEIVPQPQQLVKSDVTKDLDVRDIASLPNFSF